MCYSWGWRWAGHEGVMHCSITRCGGISWWLKVEGMDITVHDLLQSCHHPLIPSWLQKTIFSSVMQTSEEPSLRSSGPSCAAPLCCSICYPSGSPGETLSISDCKLSRPPFHASNAQSNLLSRWLRTAGGSPCTARHSLTAFTSVFVNLLIFSLNGFSQLLHCNIVKIPCIRVEQSCQEINKQSYKTTSYH